MDEFTNTRLNTVAEAFVESYAENKILAAKLVDEAGIDPALYPALREKINGEFLKRGYTFDEE